jgi:hypothetical protein
MILRTIEVRLGGVSEATTRARWTFIILLIASSAILITLWNTYYSYTAKYAYDESLEFEATKFDIAAFKKRDSKNPLFLYIYNKLDLKTQQLLKELNAPAEDMSDEDILKIKAANEKIEAVIVGKINNEILKNPLLYTSQELKNAYCFSLKKEEQVRLASQRYSESSTDLKLKAISKNLKVCPQMSVPGEIIEFSDGEIQIIDFTDREIEKIEKLLSDKGHIENHPKTLNHVNNFLLQRTYPEIGWNMRFTNKDAQTSLLSENNKKEIATEWIKNQSVSIDILGITINANEFSIIGSVILTLISIWLFFCIRRENRAIVSLLRDVRKDVNRPSDTQIKGDENWDIANLAFYGIVHKLLFSHTGGTDRPMSRNDVFDNERFPKTDFDNIVNIFIGFLTKFVRLFVMLLVFLPFITIVATIYVDIDSTYTSFSPFRINPEASFIERNTNQMEMDINRIFTENTFAVSLGLFTFLLSVAALVFQQRTTQALKEFEKRLDATHFDPYPTYRAKIKALIFKAFFSDNFS